MSNILIGIFLLFQTPVQAEEVPVVKELTIEEKITQTFNNPRMVDVLRCESQLKQFDEGEHQRLLKPLISKTSDVGIAQINQVHWSRAKELGLDIFNSEADNLKMAKIIYDEQGLDAWTCNKKVP